MTALFGDELATESYTDFFHGKTLDGGDFATCQAYLLGERGSRFNGRLFVFDRVSRSPGAPAATEGELSALCGGRVRLYAGPCEFLVAIEGRKGFTPGLGFRFRRGEERVRAMFDDLAASLALLRLLKTRLDP